MVKTTNRNIKEISFAELFEGSFYVIPFYQRSYSWGKDNISQLWEDIVNVQKLKDDPLSSGSHFMSSLLVKASKDRGRDTFHVVDGQQRITTIYLALKAAQDVLERSKYRATQSGSRMADRLKELLYGKNYNFEVTDLNLEEDSTAEFSDPRLTLQGQSDDNPFNVLIYRGHQHWNVTHSKSKVAFTYRFFKRKFESLINSSEPKNFFSVVDIIMTGLHMIYIPILEHEAPQKIFESVNGLTKKLYAGELIKNYLLMSIPDEETANRIYTMYWAEFDKPAWTETDKNKEELTKMLYYWVCSRGFKAQRGTDEHIYRSFKIDAAFNSLNPEEASKKAEQLSALLHKTITTLNRLADSRTRPRNRLEKSYSRIYSVKDTINSKSAFILFLQHIDEIESHYGRMSDDQLDKLLLPLESYIIRKVLSSYGYSGRTSEHLVDIARKVFTVDSFSRFDNIDDYLDDVVKRFARELAYGLESNRRFDSNAALFDYLVGNINKGLPPKQITSNYHDVVKMLLVQVENHLSKDSFNPEGTNIIAELSIEHWLPQHSNPDDWPLYDEKDRILYTNTLGNLCIIPPRINSSLGNASLSDKIEKVTSILKQDNNEKTTLQTLNKVLELCGEESSHDGSYIWTEEQMEKRASWIMGIILNDIFKDIEHFTGEARPSISTSASIWQPPVAGRRIVATRGKTVVRAYQQADGTLVIDEVYKMMPEPRDHLHSAARIKREEFIKQSIKEKDGTYTWKGSAYSSKRTSLLAVFMGFAMSDVWKLEQ